MNDPEVALGDSGPWTRFMDMHSGGQCKEPPYEYIYIEAPENEAKRIFAGKFGHNPERVSCTCCGGDYSIDESETLVQATAYDRNCAYAYVEPDGTEHTDTTNLFWPDVRAKGWTGRYVEHTGSYGREVTSLGEYLNRPDVLIVRAAEIEPAWRTTELRESGYVWVD